MWDVVHERPERSVPAYGPGYGAFMLIPTAFLLIVGTVITIESWWALVGITLGSLVMALMDRIYMRAMEIKHRPWEPAHYMPERAVLPDLIAAVNSKLWEDWVDDFRAETIADMNKNVVLAYDAEHVRNALQVFIQSRMDAFVKNN